MLIGYGRCSTDEQDLTMQIDALKAAGCKKIFSEHGSGRKVDRPELIKLLGQLRAGDTVVVYKMDRISRSVADMISIGKQVDEIGADFLSLKDGGIDTASPTGKFFFHILAALAQLEADITSQRTKDGLAAARARGRKGGRRHQLTDEQVSAARLMKENGKTIVSIAQILGVSRSTMTRYMANSC